MKVQDVSHRTGHGVGHTLVEATEKHTDMVEGRGREEKQEAQPRMRRCGGRGRWEDVAESFFIFLKSREDLGGDGGTWHREKVRGGIVKGKRQLRGVEGAGRG